MVFDNASFVVALVFVVAFWAHVINDNIPASFEIWPAPQSAVHTMDAVVFRTHGPAADVLSYETNHPRPLIHANQVLVEVAYSSINPCDYKVRRNWWVPGFLSPKPKIPGEDISGEIVEVGTKVMGNWEVGDRVAAMMPIMGARWGALAGYAAVDPSFLAKLGENTSFQQAAALPLVSLTAIQGLTQLDTIGTRSILIQAGAGGVGTFAIQYAKHVLNIETVATTASAGKAALLKELGADLVVDYRENKFEDIIQDYDAVLDPMSWTYEDRTLAKGVLKRSGHYLNILSSDSGFGDGVERGNGLSMVKNFVVGTVVNLIRTGYLPKYSLVTVVPNGEQLQSVMDLVDKGIIRPIIDRTFALSDAAQAFEYLEEGHATGKVLLEHKKN
jgi:alcohol dehydrogenase